MHSSTLPISSGDIAERWRTPEPSVWAYDSAMRLRLRGKHHPDEDEARAWVEAEIARLRSVSYSDLLVQPQRAGSLRDHVSERSAAHGRDLGVLG